MEFLDNIAAPGNVFLVSATHESTEAKAMTFIAVILGMLLTLIPSKTPVKVVVIPPMPQHKPSAMPFWQAEEIAYWEKVDALATPDDKPEDKPVSIEEITGEEFTWEGFYVDAYCEYADEFTALFNSYDYKVSKNGRSMIKRPGDKSFKFVAKGK